MSWFDPVLTKKQMPCRLWMVGVSVFSLFLVFATGTDKKHGKPTVIIAL